MNWGRSNQTASSDMARTIPARLRRWERNWARSWNCTSRESSGSQAPIVLRPRKKRCTPRRRPAGRRSRSLRIAQQSFPATLSLRGTSVVVNRSSSSPSRLPTYAQGGGELRDGATGVGRRLFRRAGVRIDVDRYGDACRDYWRLRIPRLPRLSASLRARPLSESPVPLQSPVSVPVPPLVTAHLWN